jgi:hypothetical protein
MNSPQFVRRVDAALRPLLGEDRILIGAQVVAGPPLAIVNCVSAVVFVASGTALACALITVPGDWPASGPAIGFWVAEIAALLIGLLRFSIQRPMLVAVTNRQFVCGRLSTFRKVPSHAVTAPLNQVRITGYRSGRWTTTLRCQLPGMGPVRLTAVNPHRADLDRTLAAVHAASPTGGRHRSSMRNAMRPNPH